MIIRGKHLPMCFVLLPDKKEITYNKMFGLLLRDFNEDQQPIKIYLDFEKAALNSI